jgi:hypothetical protein
MSMGTKTGAMMAHFAEALPMKRLMKADTRMKATRAAAGEVDGLEEARAEMARMRPRFDQLKKAMKWAATKASTMYAPIEDMVSEVIAATSLSFRTLPVTIP